MLTVYSVTHVLDMLKIKRNNDFYIVYFWTPNFIVQMHMEY